MSIHADFHMHSLFSGDGKAPMEQMIKAAIQKGMTEICFTEHHDIDFPVSAECPEGYFSLNTDSYLYDLLSLRNQYQDRIRINFGVELGLGVNIWKKLVRYMKDYEFDFVIGSSHLAHGKDPYDPSYFAGRSEEEAYGEYFSSIAENIKRFQNFDVYGHLDYVVRYGPNRDNNYRYENYKDFIDPILALLVTYGKGLEINTAGLSYGLKHAHPVPEILTRFRELGGDIITIGSDAHTPEQIGYAFDYAADLLKDCGFKYFCTFQNRLPEYHKL